jgi:aspartate kinase
LDIVKELTLDHTETAKQHIRDPDILNELLAQLEGDCRRLRSFLQAAEVGYWINSIMRLITYVFMSSTRFKIIEEISPRSKDIIVGMGETLSCQIVAAVLKDKVRASKRLNDQKGRALINLHRASTACLST